MQIRKIFEDNEISLYYFTIANNTEYLNDIISVEDEERVITYDDTIISEDGKVCMFYYIPKKIKNSVFIRYDLLPFRKKNFILLKKK